MEGMFIFMIECKYIYIHEFSHIHVHLYIYIYIKKAFVAVLLFLKRCHGADNSAKAQKGRNNKKQILAPGALRPGSQALNSEKNETALKRDGW